MIENLYLESFQNPTRVYRINGGEDQRDGKCCTIKAGVWINDKYVYLTKDIDYQSYPKIDHIIQKWQKLENENSKRQVAFYIGYAVFVISLVAICALAVFGGGLPLVVSSIVLIAASVGLISSISVMGYNHYKISSGLTGPDLLEDLRKSGISSFETIHDNRYYGYYLEKGERLYANYKFRLELDHIKFKEYILSECENKEKFLEWKYTHLKRPEFADLMKEGGKYYDPDFILTFSLLNQTHNDHGEGSILGGLPEVKIGVR